jgi:hypothetical protein
MLLPEPNLREAARDVFVHDKIAGEEDATLVAGIYRALGLFRTELWDPKERWQRAELLLKNRQQDVQRVLPENFAQTLGRTSQAHGMLEIEFREDLD